MNVGLLLQVRERILANPEGYNQSSYCGTAHCIAGHIVAMADPRLWAEQRNKYLGPPEEYRVSVTPNRAAELLGADREATYKLFALHQAWPEEFSRRYREAGRDEDWMGRAQAAADCIIDFIITDGWTTPADPSKLVLAEAIASPETVEHEVHA